MQNKIQKIVETVREVCGPGIHALHEPMIGAREKELVADCISKNQLTQGEYIERFEQMLCNATGAKYAVVTCNATCALVAALELDLKNADFKIRVPSLTFAATASAVKNSGNKIRLVDHADANIAVYLLGHTPSCMGDFLISDAAQALGTENIMLPAVISFNSNKIISTGQGGVYLTNYEDDAKAFRHLISTARMPHPYKIEHDIGAAHNYRMPNINAALGVAQMEIFPHILKAKRALAHKYHEAFLSIDIRPSREPAGTKSNYWLNSIYVDKEIRDPAIEALQAEGLMARCLPAPLHTLEPYKKYARGASLPLSEMAWRGTITLPSSAYLGEKYL